MALVRDIVTGDELTFEEQRGKIIRSYTDIVMLAISLGNIGQHFNDEIGVDKFIEEDYNFKIKGDDAYKGSVCRGGVV